MNRAIEELTGVSDMVYSRVAQKRYRDVSPLVRSTVLNGLCAILLAAPEVYVQVKPLSARVSP